MPAPPGGTLANNANARQNLAKLNVSTTESTSLNVAEGCLLPTVTTRSIWKRDDG